jgi:hypothetical protein
MVVHLLVGLKFFVSKLYGYSIPSKGKRCICTSKYRYQISSPGDLLLFGRLYILTADLQIVQEIGMTGIIPTLHHKLSWRAQRELYLCCVIHSSKKRTDYKVTFYRGSNGNTLLPLLLWK